MTNATEFAAIALVMTQGTAVSTAIMPSLSEIREAEPNDAEMLGYLRHAEIVSTAITVGIAAVSSVILRTTLPLIIAVVLMGGIIAAYELSLKETQPNTESEMNHAV